MSERARDYRKMLEEAADIVNESTNEIADLCLLRNRLQGFFDNYPTQLLDLNIFSFMLKQIVECIQLKIEHLNLELRNPVAKLNKVIHDFEDYIET